MFYTNGKILIHNQNDVELLEEAMSKIEDHIEERKGLVAGLQISKENGYPCINLPESVEYKDLDDCLRPYVQLKAINEDSIYIAEDRIINEKYVYTEDERREIANEISKGLKDIEATEIEMKSIAKRYKSEIEAIKTKINESNDRYTQGFTYKDYKTKVKLNFLDGKKYFVDSDDETIVHRVEKMTPSEKQLRIEHTLESGINTDNVVPIVNPMKFSGEGEEEEESEKMPL